MIINLLKLVAYNLLVHIVVIVVAVTAVAIPVTVFLVAIAASVEEVAFTVVWSCHQKDRNILHKSR